MLLRIVVVTALIAAGMAGVKDGRVLDRSGLLGSCAAVAAPAGYDGAWQACRPGKLEGNPDLRRKSCVSQGVVRGIEYWRCPSSIGSGARA